MRAAGPLHADVRVLWVTKRVTQLNRKIYFFRINSLEGEFESSPGHQNVLYFNQLECFSKVTSNYF